MGMRHDEGVQVHRYFLNALIHPHFPDDNTVFQK